MENVNQTYRERTRDPAAVRADQRDAQFMRRLIETCPSASRYLTYNIEMQIATGTDKFPSAIY